MITSMFGFLSKLAVAGVPHAPHAERGTEAELDRVLERTNRLGYESTLESLRADANDGQAALIAAPVESALWYVDFDADFLESAEQQAAFLDEARDVLAWSDAPDSGPLR